MADAPTRRLLLHPQAQTVIVGSDGLAKSIKLDANAYDGKVFSSSGSDVGWARIIVHEAEYAPLRSFFH